MCLAASVHPSVCPGLWELHCAPVSAIQCIGLGEFVSNQGLVRLLDQILGSVVYVHAVWHRMSHLLDR